MTWPASEEDRLDSPIYSSSASGVRGNDDQKGPYSPSVIALNKYALPNSRYLACLVHATWSLSQYPGMGSSLKDIQSEFDIEKQIDFKNIKYCSEHLHTDILKTDASCRGGQWEGLFITFPVRDTRSSGDCTTKSFVARKALRPFSYLWIVLSWRYCLPAIARRTHCVSWAVLGLSLTLYPRPHGFQSC